MKKFTLLALAWAMPGLWALHAQCAGGTVTYPASSSVGAGDITAEAVFTGNVTIASDFSACRIHVTNGATVVVQTSSTVAPPTITVQNDVEVDSGSHFVFENGTSLYQVSNAANTGSIEYSRTTKEMYRYDYSYWSSPVSGSQTLTQFSPTTQWDKYYEWSTAVDNWVFAGNSTWTTGKGYIVRAPQTYNINPSIRMPWTGTFVGTPNNGTYSIHIDGPGHDNLVGNPYPSALNADCFLTDADNTGIGGAIYMWAHNIPITNLVYNVNDYAIYNLLGGVGTGYIESNARLITTSRPTGQIAAGQSFFVTGITSSDIYFKNSMRSGGENFNNTDFFRPGSETAFTPTCGPTERARLWLKLKKDGAVDIKETLVGYATGATTQTALDRTFDAEVYTQNPTINFYSVSPGGTALAIQGRAFTPVTSGGVTTNTININDVIPLGYTCTSGGDFRVIGGNDIADRDGRFASQRYWIRKDEDWPSTPGSGPYSYTDIRFNDCTINVAGATTQGNGEGRLAVVFKLDEPYVQSQCGVTVPMSQFIQSTTPSTDPTYGYMWELTKNGVSHQIQQTGATPYRLYWSNPGFPAGFIDYNQTYQVQIAAWQSGAWRWGPACPVSTPEANVIPSNSSCGATLKITHSQQIACAPHGNAGMSYYWTMRHVNTNAIVTFRTSTSYFTLHPSFGTVSAWVSGTMSGFLVNSVSQTESYEVSVQIDYNNAPTSTSLPVTGDLGIMSNICAFTTTATGRMAGQPSLGMDDTFSVIASPNPSKNAFGLHIESSAIGNVRVNVYDLVGKLIETREFDASQEINIGNAYQSGVYSVEVMQGANRRTLKLVKM